MWMRRLDRRIEVLAQESGPAYPPFHAGLPAGPGRTSSFAPQRLTVAS